MSDSPNDYECARFLCSKALIRLANYVHTYWPLVLQGQGSITHMLLLLQMSPNGSLYSQNHFVIAPFLDHIKRAGKHNINHSFQPQISCPDFLHHVKTLFDDGTDFTPVSLLTATWSSVLQFGGNPSVVSGVYIMCACVHILLMYWSWIVFFFFFTGEHFPDGISYWWCQNIPPVPLW